MIYAVLFSNFFLGRLEFGQNRPLLESLLATQMVLHDCISVAKNIVTLLAKLCWPFAQPHLSMAFIDIGAALV